MLSQDEKESLAEFADSDGYPALLKQLDMWRQQQIHRLSTCTPDKESLLIERVKLDGMDALISQIKSLRRTRS